MQNILVMRHGNASQLPGQSDWDREISVLGKMEIEKSASELKERNLKPDLVLVSPIKRAQQTFEILQSHFKTNLTKYDSNALIYTAPLSGILSELEAYDESSILLIGHQPLLGDFIHHSLSKRMMVEVPTASVTSLVFPAGFKSGKAKVEWQILPGHL